MLFRSGKRPRHGGCFRARCQIEPVEKPIQIMLIAGEPSGDMLGAGLVQELRGLPGFEEAVFFGAGGERMAKAGVDLAFDLTRHSVIGLIEVIRKYGTFRRLFRQLARLAETRRPDVVVGIDFGAFNLRLARRIRDLSRATLGTDRKSTRLNSSH